MFTPDKMEQLQVVFASEDTGRVAEALVRLGAMHLVDIGEIESWAAELEKGRPGDSLETLRNRRERVETLIKHFGIPVEFRGITGREESWASAEPHLEKIERSNSEIRKKENSLNDSLSQLREMFHRIHGLSGISLPEEDEYGYLHIEAGRLDPALIPEMRNRLAGRLHIYVPLETGGKQTAFFIVGLKSDSHYLKTLMREIGVESYQPDETAKLSPEHLKGIEERIQRESAELEAVQREGAALAEKESGFLLSLLKKLRTEGLRQQILTYFRHTERTCLVSGWVPIARHETVVRELKSATNSRCVIEALPAESVESVKAGKMQVPVRMNNPSFLKPFELLTSTYGVPSYRSLDPTPILGISFMLMFGMMFGDVGHGLILALAGLLLIGKSKKTAARNAGYLVLYGGAASICFGFLFGSIFGVEHWVPALWVKPMDSIGQLFKVTIIFGIVMISLSMIINMINGFRKRDLLSSIFDKAGLIAMILYWCSIVVAIRAISPGMVAVPVIIPVLMVSSLVLLFLKEPIVHLLRGKKNLFPEGVATGIMGGIVEILEIVLGFLANTVSFIRVAAFGLAHAGLFMAIFALSEAVKGSAHGFFSGLVLIFGNILIICLEGLVVSIQAVRLEFYEFFSRFFEQTEAGYKPVEVE